ncbi:60S ribosomal protein L7a-1 [Sesamum alatum]|uniref:60S ribosomal protein L7a n=1 Tax=Sesamum alatum TaxID=300844 RepID=A0AAE1Y958_9LAMI|nr:60S ribosomal protein L7a-1 [Sesamum alatum]
MVKINDAIKYSIFGASRCEGSSNIEPSSLINQNIQDYNSIEPSLSNLLDEESPLKKICIRSRPLQQTKKKWLQRRVQSCRRRKKVEKVVNPLFEKRPKQFGIGGALPPKKDLHRFVKWPQVVRIQRKKMILKQRLKVPPPIHQFSKTLDKNLATSLFKMLLKYRPEDRAQKKERLLKRAQAEAEGKAPEVKKPIVVKYGLNHVTYLIEQNKAQLVVIAHDVDPIELVVWLPALCRKMEIPYCIVKGKARLGTIVHKKTASVLCLTSVKNEDKLEFSKILEAIKANFNDKYDEMRKKWGGGVMGSKSQAKTKAKERVLAKEAAQRMS